MNFDIKLVSVHSIKLQ